MRKHNGNNTPQHPGKILFNDFIVPNGLTITTLARAIDVDVPRVSEIVLGKRRITPETALKLAQYFKNTKPMDWLLMQMEYELSQEKTKSVEKKRNNTKPQSFSYA